MSLDDFKYESKGSWGKLTEITVTVLNNGNNNFQPKVLVMLYDDKDKKEDWFQAKEEIEFDIFGLGVNEHITKNVVTNIAFDNLDLPKKMKLVLVDAFDWSNRVIVTVDKEFLVE